MAKRAAAKKSTPVKKTAATKATAAKRTAAKKSAPVKEAAATKAAATKAAATKAAPARKSASVTKAAARKSAPATKVTAAKKAAAAPEMAANSRFFAAARKRAERVLKDPERLQQIAKDSYKSGAARSGPFGAVMDDFKTLIRLVVAYARGHYRDIPADSLAVIVGALIYVVSPLDLIPDVLPGGFADDAAVVVWVIKSVRSELDAFRAWELGADEG